MSRDREAAALAAIRLTLTAAAVSFSGGAALVFSKGAAAVVWCTGAALILLLALLFEKTGCECGEIAFDGRSCSFMSGIFLRRRVRLEKNEISSVKTVQTPVQRLFGVSNVIFRTNGRSFIAFDVHMNEVQPHDH